MVDPSHFGRRHCRIWHGIVAEYLTAEFDIGNALTEGRPALKDAQRHDAERGRFCEMERISALLLQKQNGEPLIRIGEVLDR